MSSSTGPRRHGSLPPGYQPQLPQEIIDLLLKALRRYTFDVSDLANLRFLCRNFSEQLRSTVLGSKICYVYLDEAGLNELETMTLSQPRLTQFIEKFAIGGRRVAQQSLVLKKKGRLMNLPMSPADENRAIHHFAAGLEGTMKSANFRWSSMTQILKERGNEYTIEDNDLDTEGCRMLPADTDFMPSQALINRFVKLLHNFDFTSLDTIISNELVQHVRVIVRDSSNSI